MSGLRRALAALAVAGLAVGLIAVLITFASDHEKEPVPAAGLGLLVGWSWIGTGLYAWWRRPQNRFGALMTAVGFAWFIPALSESDSDYVFTIGAALGSLYLAIFVHMLLAYPDGHVATHRQRWLVAAVYAIATLGPLPILLVGDGSEFGCDNCPDSVINISGDTGLASILDALTSGLAVLLLGPILVVLVRRWRAASAPQRRAMAPVLWSGIVLLDILAASLTSDAIGATSLSNVFGLIGLLALFVVPWAFLFGLLRSRVNRAAAVGELLAQIGQRPGTLRLCDLLADALRDPSLRLIYRLDKEDGWVDGDGHATEPPPEDDPVRAATAVELEGRVVGLIIHDRSLCEDPELMRSVSTAAALAVGHERLQAQLRARVEQLRASRARIVEATTAERRRLERDLHDGAQQRLVALSLTLRMAQTRVGRDDGQANDLLDGAQQELTLALAELRELARGIHPAVLSDRGLDAALESLAGRSPVPVRLAGTPGERLPDAVAAAAYFVVAEALTNVAKYAAATQATVSVERRNGSAYVEVSDDGIGGADPARGSGLQGLADRLSALDGKLEVESYPGHGTRLRAEIPV